MGRLIIGLILIVSGTATLFGGSIILGMAGIVMGFLAITQSD